MGINTVKNGCLLGSLPILAVVGFVFLRSAKPRRTLNNHQITNRFAFGSVMCEPQERQATIHKKTIGLTRNETLLLPIFALSPNETIARNLQQKEIWENEGVIIERILDIFISKLRKKLELDPN